MNGYIALFYTPGVKIVEIPQPAVVRQISSDEEIIRSMWSAIEGGEKEEWVRENLLRLDQWPCILVGWRRLVHRRLFREERLPKGTTTILYPEEWPGKVRREIKEEGRKFREHDFGITRSDVGRLEIAHASNGCFNVDIQREDDGRPFVSFGLTVERYVLVLTLKLLSENKGFPVEGRISLYHTHDYDQVFLRATVQEGIEKVIPRGVVIFAGNPDENHLVYVCADRGALLHHLPRPRR